MSVPSSVPSPPLLRRRQQALAARRARAEAARAKDPARVRMQIEAKRWRWAGALVVAIAAAVGSWSPIVEPTVVIPRNQIAAYGSFFGKLLFDAPWPFFPVLIAGIGFALCYRHRTRVHELAILLAAVLMFLSIYYVAFWWDAGLRTYGSPYAQGVLAVSIASWITIAVLALLSWLRSSVILNWTFLVFLFSWLGWYAFPWFGSTKIGW